MGGRVRVLLASASPRRQALLAAACIACDVDPVDVDERRRAGESPETYVERLARDKAAAGAARHPARIVIGADTAVVIDGEILGKPRDADDAAGMLRRLSGRTHEVLTGVAVAAGGGVRASVDRTIVWFDRLTDADIAEYVATGEPMDKAGAYAIQGWASRVIPRIEGSYSNVVGLPVPALIGLLQGLGRAGG